MSKLCWIDLKVWFKKIKILLAQESISPKANAKIVWKKRNCSFFIENQYVPDT